MTLKNESRDRDGAAKKVVRSISISPTSWEAYKNQADAQKISVSELIDRGGRDNSNTIDPSLKPRLLDLVEMPISIFWSLTECIRRLSVQLGLGEDFTEQGLGEEERKKRIIKQRNIVDDYLWRAMQILTLSTHCICELIPNNTIPMLRWISVLMLLHDIEEAPSSPSGCTLQPKVTELEMDKDIATIQAMFGFLETNSPHYRVLELEVKGKMSFAQIANFMRLNSQYPNINETEIRRQSSDAVRQLRTYIYQTFNDKKLTVSIEKEQKRIAKLSFDEPEKGFLDRAKKYYELCSKATLQGKEEITTLKNFFYEAVNDPTMEFWIEEIDHLAGYRLGNLNPVLENYLTARLETKEIHFELQKVFKERIEKDNELSIKASKIDLELRHCYSRKELINLVEKTVWEISNKSLHLHDITFINGILEQAQLRKE